jgi:hypothetical protein
MGQSASQATAFYRDVAKNRKMWTAKSDKGFVLAFTSSGKEVMPFWSSLSRVKKTITNCPSYNTLQPVEISWDVFVTKWVPKLKQDNVQIGLNWSGKRATGFDRDPEGVKQSIEFFMLEELKF